MNKNLFKRFISDSKGLVTICILVYLIYMLLSNNTIYIHPTSIIGNTFVAIFLLVGAIEVVGDIIGTIFYLLYMGIQK